MRLALPRHRAAISAAPIRKETVMLKLALLTSSALAALLLCTACEQQQQSQDTQATEAQTAQDAQPAQPAQDTAPTAAERAAAEAANEIDQAAAPTTEITPAELANGVSAEQISEPEKTLATASVRTSNGEALGEVRSVVVGPDGKADAVVVEVGGFLNVGERAVSIEANKFTYLKDRNILVAAVVKADVENLPAVEPR
jgi:cytoskeletal protein RodZ